jgi:hypothetical protein
MKKVNKAYQLYLEQERELRAKLYNEIELEFINVLENNGCQIIIEQEEGLPLKPAENYEETASVLSVELLQAGEQNVISIKVYEYGSYMDWGLDEFDIDERIALLKYISEQEAEDDNKGGNNN